MPLTVFQSFIDNLQQQTLLRVHGCCFLARDVEEAGVEQTDILIKEVAILGVGLTVFSSEFRLLSWGVTNRALVRAIGMIERVDIESICGHLAL